MSTVFISYKRIQPDLQLAKQIAKELIESGHEVFIDTEIPPGAVWSDEIATELEKAQVFVVLLSEHSIASQMVVEEVCRIAERFRQTRTPTIFPIRIALEKDLPYELGAHLNQFQQLNWKPGEDIAEITTRLLETIRTVKGGTPGRKRNSRRSKTKKHGEPTTEPISWLHLSDLHLGCRGSELWWQVHEEFESSIRKMLPRVGVPDLILMTGDLSNTGAAEEFELLDRFLDTLLGWLNENGIGPQPLIIPVPGNHDLLRPEGREAFPYRILDK